MRLGRKDTQANTLSSITRHARSLRLGRKDTQANHPQKEPAGGKGASENTNRREDGREGGGGRGTEGGREGGREGERSHGVDAGLGEGCRRVRLEVWEVLERQDGRA